MKTSILLMLELFIFLLFTVMYRVVIKITSVQYEYALGDRSSAEFLRLADSVKNAVESLYRNTPGTQTVRVLQFR